MRRFKVLLTRRFLIFPHFCLVADLYTTRKHLYSTFQLKSDLTTAAYTPNFLVYRSISLIVTAVGAMTQGTKVHMDSLTAMPVRTHLSTEEQEHETHDIKIKILAQGM